MKKYISIASAFIVFFIFTLPSFAAINFTVTPIKYELELQPGEVITLPASIRNNGDTPVTLPTAASDFESSGTDGTPRFLRKSELVFPDQQLSTWISIEDASLSIAPGEEETTNFTISVPETATPGGHYGAVFFKNDGSETSTSGNVGINVDYGIIILVNVSGEVIVDVEIGDPTISGGGSRSGKDICAGPDQSGSYYDGICNGNNSWYVGDDENGNPIYEYPDSCPLGDFTPSRYDGACIGNVPHESDGENITSPSEFEIDFTLPIDNKGNTHIKPEGKIILKDENGDIIKSIGKKTLINDRGAIIGEEVVDYIPINDQGGNVLPNSQRIYESKWKGFPYKDYDSSGNEIVYYWTPSEYYTDQNKRNSGFLMFWERVSEIRQQKLITADIEILYYDEDGNPIKFNTAKEFPIQYIEERVTLNPYIVLALLLLATTGVFILFAVRWWFLVFATAKCWSCKEKIKGHWKTCPYCKTIQNKKEQKKFEKQSKKKKK